MLNFFKFLVDTKIVFLILKENMGYHLNNLKLYAYMYFKHLLSSINFELTTFKLNVISIYKD